MSSTANRAPRARSGAIAFSSSMSLCTSVSSVISMIRPVRLSARLSPAAWSILIVSASSSTGAEVQRTYDRQSGKMIGFSQMDMLTKFQTTIRLQSEE